MNLRLFLRPVVVLLLFPCAFGQQAIPQMQTKAETLQRIAAYEAALKDTHESYLTVAKGHERLASLYMDVGRYGESEVTLERAVSLLRGNSGPTGELAKAIDTLGWLHVEM